MTFIQALRRLQQKSNWSTVLNKQYHHLLIIEKLYLKNGLEIRMTCPGCPEQYEIFKDGQQVAYYRLRHGTFRIDYPTCGDETIYVNHPSGDGIFDDDERFIYLSRAMRIVLSKLREDS